MRLPTSGVLALELLFAVPASAQDRLMDEFSPPGVDWNLWCPCLINMTKSPITFLPDPDQVGDYFAQITVDEDSLGGNVCRRGAPIYECGKPAQAFGVLSGNETLGPSFITEAAPAGVTPIVQANEYCTHKAMQRAASAGEEGECIQRQELQFQKQFSHDADQAYFYSFRFRMPGVIEDKQNSIRWVIAQWKQEPVSSSYGDVLGSDWAPSPFLAQRFDNGVLHITVQDEHCRCMVASAPLADGTILFWKDGTPQYCISTKPGNAEGKACTANLIVEYGPNPVLTSPVDKWVELSYRVQASRTDPAVIEVDEGNRVIVRITGKIGYEPLVGETSRTKFKIGQYRDYMPYEDPMDIDWIQREPL